MVAKRHKNRAEAGMQHHKGLRVRRCEDPFFRGEAVCHYEDPLRSSELESPKSKALGLPL